MIGAERPGTQTAEQAHIPVLLQEVVDALSPKDGGVYVDGTFGAGGYTTAILEAAQSVVWAIDRDPSAFERGQVLAEKYPARLHLVAGRFGDMADLLASRGVNAVD